MELLRVEQLTKRFGGLTAVDDVSFGVREGEIYTIIGPNGAGKTTIFNLVSLIYPASAGRIVYRGEDLTSLAPDRVVSRGIGRTFQNIELFEHATVLQNLLIGCHAQAQSNFIAEMLFLPSVRRREVEHRRRVEKVIDFLNLQVHRDSRVAGLPYGVRNVEETDDMAYWIQDIRDLLGITVLMVEHDMSLVSRVSDRVLAVNYGKVLAEGSPSEVQSHPDVIAAYLGD
jgi:branched-chain amino acid transport system ATP-binding protein